MITLENIISDALNENENDVYYWDSLNEVGYHIYIPSRERVVCMKNTGKQIVPITKEEFLEAVNCKCYGHSISAFSYYSFK